MAIYNITVSVCGSHCVFTAPGNCCKSAPHFHQLAWSHPGYYSLHGTRQRSAHLFYSWKMEKENGRQDDKEHGGGRHRRRTVLLMYSFGPASVIKQHFSALCSIRFLSLCFINNKRGRQHKQMSVVSANQDLLDTLYCCFAFAYNFTWKKAGNILGREEKCVFFPTGLHVDVFAMQGNVTSNKSVVV